MSDQTRYDLFVSYVDSDRAWVAGFLLPALGLPADRVITQQTLTPGAGQADEFERAVRESRFTAVVLTPAYLTDRWAMFGERLATWTGVDRGEPQMVPLVLEPVSLPGRLASLVRLDFTDKKTWSEEADRLRKLLDQPPSGPEPDIVCPYPGMPAFEGCDEDRFFGREQLVGDTVDRFTAQSFLTFIGPSGSGKSSFINAGVICALKDDARFGGVEPVVVRVRPGASPISRLAAEIATKEASDPAELAMAIDSDPDAIRRALERVTAAANSATFGLLVFDQFEEAFAQCKDLDLRRRFFAVIDRLLNETPPRWLVVIAIRSDFYGEAQGSPLWARMKSALVDVPPLVGDDLRQAIELPAEKVGVYLESRLVDRLVEDAKNEKGPLPLIQQTLVTMWAKYLRRRLLTLADYESLGSEGRTGLQKALANWADGTLSELSGAGQEEIARRIFIRLIAFGEERKDTRRQQSREDLISSGVAESDVDLVLETLVRRRLVTADSDPTTHEPLVDLAHETLIEAWPTLHDWVIAYETMESERRQLVMAAEAWRKHPGDDSYAITGSRLRDTDAWRKAWPREVGQRELEFIEASRAVHRKWIRVRRAGAAAGVAVAAVVVGAVVWFGRLELIRSTTGSPLVAIPAGPAVIGWAPEGGANHTVALSAYRIEAHEVSQQQFASCHDNGPCGVPVESIGRAPAGGDMPVTNVTPQDAAVYCSWIGRRLPTAVEWERTARGPAGPAWPWPSLRTPVIEPVAVDFETAPISDGIHHLLDNVGEWVTVSGTPPFAVAGAPYDLPTPTAVPLSQSAGRPAENTGFRCAVDGN
jgi:hypothetical protein